MKSYIDLLLPSSCCCCSDLFKKHSVFTRQRGDRRRNCRSDRRAKRLLEATVAAIGCGDDRLVLALCKAPSFQI